MLGSILLWLPSLNMPLDIDAACYAVAAYWWAQGDTLYRNFTITRPQGIFVVYRLIQSVGLDSVAEIRFAGALYCALCVVALLLVVRRVWGEAIGFGAAGLFALIMALPSLEGPATNAELYMLLPLLLSLFLLLLADESPLGSRRNLLLLAGCGFCGAVALIIKPSGVAALALAAIWLLRRQYRERFPWSAWLRAECALGTSFLLGLLPALLHGLLTAPDMYLYAVFLYRLETASAVSRPLTAQLGRFVFVTGQVLVKLPILLIAASGWVAVRRTSETRDRDLLYLWTLVSLGGAWLGGNWWIHYYQQLVPPLAVAIVLGLRYLFAEAKPSHAIVVQRSIAALSLGVLAVTLVVGLTVRRDSNDVLVGYTPAPRSFEAVSAYLRQHAHPDDTLYVAYDQAQIYYLSSLRPVGRWPDIPDMRHVPGAFAEQVALLNDPATAPTYIVGAQPFDVLGLDPEGALRAIVARDYALESTVEGMPIFRRVERAAR
ncbi:MAG TPA: hypothetical protein VIL85_28660 [Thermomicrobiales bacterium]|jgi:hypothetical protein